MKFLHTSDWHLGRSLYGRSRYDEFAAFLDWLAEQIRQQEVAVLLVAGDIFDTSTPSNKAQALYYRFLCNVAGSGCRHVVVIGGNHDSPTFLNAPKELLRALNVHVVGAMTENIEDEVLVLQDRNGGPECIVCAVPYLRDRDIRTALAGESVEEKSSKLIDGVRDHYGKVVELAVKKQQECGGVPPAPPVPIIAMGHLFAAGGKTVEGDGVRELYVGSLAQVSADIFPPAIDYLALGHLHVGQRVGKLDHLRYCGSPIPMGFGEAKQQKNVILVDLTPDVQTIKELPVPCFQSLEKISGSLDVIETKIAKLKLQKSHAWLEIEYSGTEIVGNLRERVEEMVAGTSMELRRIKNKFMIDRIMTATAHEETLDDLDVEEVFSRCLEAHSVPDEDRLGFIQSYREIIDQLLSEDKNSS